MSQGVAGSAHRAMRRAKVGPVVLPRPAAPAILAGTGLVGFFGLAWLRFATLNSQAFDLAYFDQVVWNASRGHGLVSSFNPYPFFGQHFEPALAAFMPLYALHATPLWLLLGQSLALALAVLPLHALARRWLGPGPAAAACLAYLLQLFVVRAAAFDFHTEALAVPFVFWAVLAAERGQTRLLVLAGSVPMLCKEDGALVSLGLGLLALAVFQRRAGILLMALAAVYALLVTALVMPALRAGAPSDIVLRYGYLGSSVAGIGLGLFTHPGKVAAHLLAPPALGGVALSLAGLAFLPLLRPVGLLAALPALALALLSDAPAQHQLLYQYGLQAGPLLTVAALLGWRRLGPGRRLAWAMPVAAAIALAAAGPRISLDGWQYRGDSGAVLAQVPAGASVAASRNLLPRLSERRDIAQFPHVGSLEKTWVVLDRRQDPPDAEAALAAHGYEPATRSGDFSLWRRR